MKAQDKQESARVSVYEICSPGKAGAFQKPPRQRETLCEYTCVCVSRAYAFTFRPDLSFIYFLVRRGGAKCGGYIDSRGAQRISGKQKQHFFARFLKAKNVDVSRYMCKFGGNENNVEKIRIEVLYFSGELKKEIFHFGA